MPLRFILPPRIAIATPFVSPVPNPDFPASRNHRLSAVRTLAFNIGLSFLALFACESKFHVCSRLKTPRPRQHCDREDHACQRDRAEVPDCESDDRVRAGIVGGGFDDNDRFHEKILRVPKRVFSLALRLKSAVKKAVLRNFS